MTNPIRVFVLDDHSLFREGLLRLIDADDWLTAVGSADSAAAFFSVLDQVAIDVLILDYDLGDETALDVVRQLAPRGFQGSSLIVTAGLPDRDALELIRLGVSGIFHKKNSPEELHRNIREVAEGKVLIDKQYLQELIESVAVPEQAPLRLTERDRAVFRLLLEGASNKEIAARQNLSESAVKAALQQLFAKAGVRSRSQLVRFALEHLGGEI